MSRLIRSLATLLALIPVLAFAGLLTQATQSSAPASGGEPGGDWADIKITDVDTIGASMGVDGRTVGVTVGSDFTGLSQQLTAGNGATMDIVTGGSFDGLENAVRIYPPTACVPSPCNETNNAQYASWVRNLDLWNNGALNIAQVNVRWLQYFGSTYYRDAAPAKIGGVFAQDSLTPSGGAIRQAIWEAQDIVNWTPYKYWGTTSTSVMYFPGVHIDSEPDTNKLMQIGGSAVHANNPPRIGGEWVCFEQVVDLRQDRGNVAGMNKLLLSTRDGVVDGRYIQAPANWREDWSFTYQYVAGWEGLGFYYNRAGVEDPDSYTMFSHFTVAANLGHDETIGCDNISGWRQ